MTKPIVAVQARMSSKRLPGKVMMDLCGEPMIRRIWDNLEAPAWNRIILTSNDPTDDPLVQYCLDNGLICRSGPLHDVLARYIEFMKRAKPPIMVRVCGDAPFLKKSWIYTAIDHIEKTNEPVFIPGALHAGTYEDWMDCWNITSNWEPDREHAGHDWFKLHGHVMEMIPENYITVNTKEEMEEARKRWAIREQRGA